MSSILFSESKGGRTNPLRDLSRNLEGASSSREAASSSRASERASERRAQQEVSLDPYEELVMSNVWMETRNQKDRERKAAYTMTPRESFEFDNVVMIQDTIKDYETGFDDLVQGIRSHEANVAAEALESIDQKKVFDENEAFIKNYNLNSVVKIHSILRRNVINELEKLKRGDEISNTWYSTYLKSLLHGEDVIHETMTPIEIITLYYAFEYLGKTKRINWKHFLPSLSDEVMSIMSSVIKEPVYSITTSLENYLHEQGDLFNYVEIIEELKKGRVLPKAQHALVLFYYIQSRHNKDYYIFINQDDLFLKKILNSNPLEMINVLTSLYSHYQDLTQIYSNRRKWAELFSETYKYVVKHPELVSTLTELLHQDVNFLFKADFNLREEMVKWRSYLLDPRLSTQTKRDITNFIETITSSLYYGADHLPNITSRL